MKTRNLKKTIFWSFMLLVNNNINQLNQYNNNEIIKSISQFKFIIKDSIILDDTILKNPEQSTLYFGTGLCTTKEITQGLPFDFVSMMTTAEQIRRILKFDHVIHLIADSHAKTNDFVSCSEVDSLAMEQKQIIQTACKNLNLTEKYRVILASEFDQTKEYQEIYSSITEKVHDYVKREWADIEYLRKYHKLALKLSWKINDKKNAHKFDECFFDTGYNQQFGSKLSFAYLLPGRTFDAKRQNVCPYTSIKEEKRILIKEDEKLVQYVKPKTGVTRATAEYLQMVVEDFEQTFGKSFIQDAPSKIDAIIQKVFFNKKI